MLRFAYCNLFLLLALPLGVFAETKYEPLITIPGINATINGNFSEYVNFLYAMAIAIAALMAVVKIIVAGVKYMTAEVVNAKGDAKKEITTALLGLLLILGAYIILYTINPQLTDQQIKFKTLPPPPTINKAPSVQSTGSTQPAPTAPAGSTQTPATTGIQTQGRIIQNARTYYVQQTAPLDYKSTNDCKDSPRFGDYSVDGKTWKGTCKLPTVISYSGDTVQGSREDCTKNKGVYDANVTTANYCIIR